MPDPADVWRVQADTDGIDMEGVHGGRVEDIRGGYLVVRRGRFFVSDSYIPFAAIASHDDRAINLNVVADDEALELWHQQPASLLQRRERTSAENVTLDEEAQLDRLTDQDGNIRLPVRQENLLTRTRNVTRGVVRIETHLFEQVATGRAPTDEAHARVERRAVGRSESGHDIVLDGGTLEIPFFGQDVDVERQVRVTEEVVIAREAVGTVRRVSGTVRTSDVAVHEERTDQRPATGPADDETQPADPRS